MIKTFKGYLGDGEEDRIRLSTKQGKIGYKIVKFQVMGIDCNEDMETTVKIFKVTQDSITADINFSDGNLLAAAIYSQHSDAHAYPEDMLVMFEQEVFNQDIYVTNKGVTYTKNINYYLELETIKMTDNQAAVSTLRDIRLNPQKGYDPA
jgi:hypothetical protein